jgi:hypothetical protein
VSFGIDVTIDSRIFKLDSVTHGTLVGDIIDNMTNIRTISLQFDSTTFKPGWNDLVSLVGRIMSAPILESPVTVASHDWIRQLQRPITQVDPGTLSADSSCYKEGRPITLSSVPVLKITSNPSSEPIVEVVTSMAGAYAIDVIDVAGQTVFSVTITPASQPVLVPLRGLPSGSYVVRYTTPVNVLTDRAVIQ